MDQLTDLQNTLDLARELVLLQMSERHLVRVTARLNRAIKRGAAPKATDIAEATIFCERLRKLSSHLVPYGLSRHADVLETILPIANEYYLRSPKRR